MRGWGGLWRAVASRCRSDWPVIVAAWLLLACATTLLSAGVLYSDTVARGGIRQAALAAPPADRAIVAHRTAGRAEVESLDALARPELEQTLRSTGGEVALVARTGAFVPADQPRDAATDLLLLASYEGIDRHATLVDGRWPEAGRDPVEAALSEGAATALGLGIGDLRSLVSVSRVDEVRLDVVVTGIWRPVADDPYWLGDPLELGGSRSSTEVTTRGPLATTLDDLVSRVASRTVDLEWRTLPAIDGLRVETTDALAADIGSLRTRLRAALPVDRVTTFTTDLPDILAGISRAALVSRSGVLLLTAQFAVLAGYAVFLVAGLLVERRRAEVALLRSRGATSAHLVAMALIEALLLAIPAALVAPFLAAGLVALLGTVGPLATAGVIGSVAIGPATYLAAAAIAVLGVVALTLPSILATGNLAGVRAAIGRQTGSTLPQRLGIDLVLIVVAVIALWQLRLYGAPLTRDARGALGIDPLLIAAPAIGLLAGAVVAIRIIPRLAEVAERVLVRRRGLVSPLGARQLARRPLRYTRSALLLMLAVALGTFAFAHAATWTRSQADQATYQAAADARALLSEYQQLPAWALGPTFRAIPGVEAATPVGRQTLDVGRAVRSGQLLAVDAAAVGTLVSVPLDGATSDPAAMLRQLAEQGPVSRALALPGEPRRLSLVVDSDLAVPADAPPPEEGSGSTGSIAVSAILIDGDGRPYLFDGSAVALAGRAMRLEVPLTIADGDEVVAPTMPLRLEAIDIQVTAPLFTVAEGSVELREVAVSDDIEGAAWTTVPFDPGAAPWSWQRIDPNSGTAPYHPPSGQPGTIAVGREFAFPGVEGPGSEPIFGSPGTSTTTFRLGAGVDAAALPAIVGTSFLDATGAAVGDTLTVQTYGRTLSIEVVGAVDAFPPLDPAIPFAVVDGPTLELTHVVEDGSGVPAQEWWLGLDQTRATEVLAALRAAPIATVTIVERGELTRSLETDPIPLGVIGALGIGALAAMAFASIGFVVSATASTSERLGEFALLQALGLSRRELSTWLSIEHAFLLAAGVLAGTALGLLLAWLVLPFATLTDSGAATVPPAVVVIPWDAILPLYLLAGGLLVVTVALVTRSLSHIPLSGVLRARDG